MYFNMNDEDAKTLEYFNPRTNAVRPKHVAAYL
jgi:hypothetical protein